MDLPPTPDPGYDEYTLPADVKYLPGILEGIVGTCEMQGQTIPIKFRDVLHRYYLIHNDLIPSYKYAIGRLEMELTAANKRIDLTQNLNLALQREMEKCKANDNASKTKINQTNDLTVIKLSDCAKVRPFIGKRKWNSNATSKSVKYHDDHLETAQYVKKIMKSVPTEENGSYFSNLNNKYCSPSPFQLHHNNTFSEIPPPESFSEKRYPAYIHHEEIVASEIQQNVIENSEEFEPCDTYQIYESLDNWDVASELNDSAGNAVLLSHTTDKHRNIFDDEGFDFASEETTFPAMEFVENAQ